MKSKDHKYDKLVFHPKANFTILSALKSINKERSEKHMKPIDISPLKKNQIDSNTIRFLPNDSLLALFRVYDSIKTPEQLKIIKFFKNLKGQDYSRYLRFCKFECVRNLLKTADDKPTRKDRRKLYKTTKENSNLSQPDCTEKNLEAEANKNLETGKNNVRKRKRTRSRRKPKNTSEEIASKQLEVTPNINELQDISDPASISSHLFVVENTIDPNNLIITTVQEDNLTKTISLFDDELPDSMKIQEDNITNTISLFDDDIPENMKIKEETKLPVNDDTMDTISTDIKPIKILRPRGKKAGVRLGNPLDHFLKRKGKLLSNGPLARVDYVLFLSFFYRLEPEEQQRLIQEMKVLEVKNPITVKYLRKYVRTTAPPDETRALNWKRLSKAIREECQTKSLNPTPQTTENEECTSEYVFNSDDEYVYNQDELINSSIETQTDNDYENYFQNVEENVILEDTISSVEVPKQMNVDNELIINDKKNEIINKSDDENYNDDEMLQSVNNKLVKQEQDKPIIENTKTIEQQQQQLHNNQITQLNTDYNLTNYQNFNPQNNFGSSDSSKIVENFDSQYLYSRRSYNPPSNYIQNRHYDDRTSIFSNSQINSNTINSPFYSNSKSISYNRSLFVSDSNPPNSQFESNQNCTVTSPNSSFNSTNTHIKNNSQFDYRNHNSYHQNSHYSAGNSRNAYQIENSQANSYNKRFEYTIDNRYNTYSDNYKGPSNNYNQYYPSGYNSNYNNQNDGYNYYNRRNHY